jgi:preprotein translocase subunit SecD
MNTVRDILRDADPLRHEPDLLERERLRLRQSVVVAAADFTVRPAERLRFRSPLAFLATVAVIFGIVAVGFQIWSQGGATLQAAAVRFEVRLAEDQPAAGLREARVSGSSGSDRSVYIHQDVIVTNSDIAQSSVVAGALPSRFSIAVQFNAAGTEKMRQATANHVGKPVAILLDGQVVSAPVLRSAISTSAVISGEYTKANAQRIVDGIDRP